MTKSYWNVGELVSLWSKLSGHPDDRHNPGIIIEKKSPLLFVVQFGEDSPVACHPAQLVMISSTKQKRVKNVK